MYDCLMNFVTAYNTLPLYLYYCDLANWFEFLNQLMPQKSFEIVTNKKVEFLARHFRFSPLLIFALDLRPWK